MSITLYENMFNYNNVSDFDSLKVGGATRANTITFSF